MVAYFYLLQIKMWYSDVCFFLQCFFSLFFHYIRLYHNFKTYLTCLDGVLMSSSEASWWCDVIIRCRSPRHLCILAGRLRPLLALFEETHYLSVTPLVTEVSRQKMSGFQTHNQIVGYKGEKEKAIKICNNCTLVQCVHDVSIINIVWLSCQ